MEFPDHPFWDFSLEVYGADGVPAACLELQEAHQLDVNIVLYCCWLGASGRGRMTSDEIAALTAAVSGWHADIVRGVRAVRQRLKDGLPPAPTELSEPLRQRIAKIEVDLEHVEQLMLAAAVDRPADDSAPAEARAADAVANIAGYMNRMGWTASAADRDSAATILAACFAEVGRPRIAELCREL